MCTKECEQVLKSDIAIITRAFENSIKEDSEKIVSCLYSCIKQVFTKWAIITYKNISPEFVTFLSDTSFTDGVLKFTEKAAQGNIYAGNAGLQTIVLAFCRNKLLENFKKEERILKKAKKFELDTNSKVQPLEEEEYITAEKRFITLETALTKMEPADRQIVVWRHLEEKSNDEIARLLDINKKSATNRIYRCMERLRILIENK